MKIALIGFGLEGQSSYDYWKLGNNVTICDQRSYLELPEDVHTQLGQNYLADLDRFDLIVRSPFVRPDALIAASSPAIISKVTTNSSEFMRVCPSKHIIGITGTKGKGTTSTLIAQFLSASGMKVHLGGNIGLPALRLLEETIQPEDWVILELSSFQLIDFKVSPHIGLCLMIVPEHLDWHPNTDEYFDAKSNLFRNQTSKDIAVYFANSSDSKRIATTGAAQKIPYFEAPGAYISGTKVVIDNQEICDTAEIKLLGRHNWENVCAALTTVWQVSHDVIAFNTVIKNFSGLEHRLEFVREIDNVRYYDDSFGTTPETAIVALQSFAGPKVIILGGSDKGASYAELAHVVAHEAIRKVLLIGEQAGCIEQAFKALHFENYQPGGNTIEQIVATARSVAQPGDVVLLAPGCASFDMFQNYKDRGDKFKRAVLQVA